MQFSNLPPPSLNPLFIYHISVFASMKSKPYVAGLVSFLAVGCSNSISIAYTSIPVYHTTIYF